MQKLARQSSQIAAGTEGAVQQRLHHIDSSELELVATGSPQRTDYEPLRLHTDRYDFEFFCRAIFETEPWLQVGTVLARHGVRVNSRAIPDCGKCCPTCSYFTVQTKLEITVLMFQ